MPTLPLHPAIVHLPLGLAFVLPLVTAGLALAVWRRRLPRTAFAVVAGLQLVLVGSGFAAMALGDREEDQVERVVAEEVIEHHEERAEAFVWTAVAVLAFSVALLVVPPGAVTALSAAVVLGTLAVAGLGVLTGHAGGQIVYLHGGASAFRGGAPAALATEREDD